MAIEICPVEDIKPGRAIRVKLGDHAIAIARTKSGEVKAIDDKCSHGEISLSEGFVDDETIECSGRNRGHACLGNRQGRRRCRPLHHRS